MPFYRSTNLSSGRQIAYYSTEASGSRAPEGLLALLMHFDGSNGSTTFTDSSSFNHTITRGSSNTIISTAQSKFGGASGYFDGSSLLNLPTGNVSTNPFCIGTNDFTFEFFLRVVSFSLGVIWECAANPASWGIAVSADSRLFWNENAPGPIYISGTLSTDTWYHVAVVRISGTLKIYIDGTERASTSSPGDLGSTVLSQNCLGASPGLFNPINAYIDEVRLIRGLGVYTSSFTPPSAPFSA